MPDLDDALLTRLLQEQARSIDTSRLTLTSRSQPRPHRRRAAVVAAPAAVVVVLIAGAMMADSGPGHRSSGHPGQPYSGGSRPKATNSLPPSAAAHDKLGVFAPACGHPGSTVIVPTTPVTVRRADCDLTGVIVRLSNGYGSVVPAEGSSEGDFDSKPGATPASGGINVSVDPDTGDVTISAVS
jgi:hypothetical protein